MKECPECNLCFDDSHNRCPHDDKSLISSIACETSLGGRYFLERKLGKGGMGSVFKGKHKFLKSSHAIKIISPEVVKSDPMLLVRFHQEAVLAASIHHPNVVSVTDFGVESEDIPFLVMEFIDGISLADFLLKEKRLSPEKAYEILAPIVLGVGAAHSRGITHRDLKPLNVMIKNGYPMAQAVKVLDFGLAKIKSTESFASLVQAKTTNLLGSPHYIPPEQWKSEDVDNRSDIYSLGVILFQMLTGEVPFKGNSIPTIMYQHLQTPVSSFASLGVSVSSEIESVIRKALAKNQDERYATVEEFLSRYEDALFKTKKQTELNLNKNIHTSPSPDAIEDQLPVTERNLEKDFSKTYNLPYLNSTQNETLTSFFNQPKPSEAAESEKLEQEFIHAQNRVEAARSKISEAEKLALEFNEAQKAAEDARHKFLQAQHKLEEDVRRQVQAEMESKLAVERKAREKAEGEAHSLMEEAKARKEAEERANALAKTALEAQQRAEKERQKAEKEIQQRQLEEGTRRKAEEAALKLAEQVAEEKRKYEEAKREAENEANFRVEAELKRKKVEEEIQRLAKYEAERRKIAEAQADQQIKEQASRLEKQALEAQQKANEARLLAESETQKREQAEVARRKAEEEARRLAEEIIEAQKRLEEAEQRAKSESEKRVLEEEARKKAEESARFLSASQDNLIAHNKKLQTQAIQDDLVEYSSPNLIEETLPNLDISSGQKLVNTAGTNISDTNQISTRKVFSPMFFAAGLTAFILISGVSGFLIYNTFLSNPSAIENIPSNPTVTNNTTQIATSEKPDRLKNKMVFIKGGTFQMGGNNVALDIHPFDYQYPAHMVDVPDFYIDRTEVSNEEYAEFIQDTKKKAPKNWKNGKPIAGQEKFPVTNITYSDASEFAAWVSRRNNMRCELPSEEQWEYAARGGSQQNTFPWGNEWIPGRANIDFGSLREVGTSGDETSSGVKDMMGNVIELTSSTFDYYPDFPEKNKDKALELNANIITVRGASFAADPKQIENKHLLLTLRQGTERFNLNKNSSYIGFRLTCRL